jgi:hypothetical protein
VENFEVGDKVVFTGSTDEQVAWGNNDDPRLFLIPNTVRYIIKDVDIHSQHTKLTLEHINGRFNSVSFKKV